MTTRAAGRDFITLVFATTYSFRSIQDIVVVVVAAVVAVVDSLLVDHQMNRFPKGTKC